MLTFPVVQRLIDHLRRPWVQRLIALVVSALLAMSLLSTPMVLTVPPAGHNVASSAWSRKRAQPADQDASRIPGLMPATQHDDRERRLV